MRWLITIFFFWAAVAFADIPSQRYDSEGNRITLAQGAQTTRFAINPNAALSQVLVRTRLDGSKTLYVYGLGLLYEVEASSANVETGVRRNYHYDYRGSTVAISDQTGAVLERIDYNIYGQITRRAGTMVDTPFLFNGRHGVMTDGNGLYCMRARFYNPYMKRFLNADPASFGGGLNFYAYADGNPISYLDPFGLSAIGDYFHDVGQVWVGYGRAVGDTATGLYNVVRHPVNTAEGLYNVATHPVQAYDAISQSVMNTWNSGLQGQRRIVGNVLIAAGTIGAGYAKGVQAAGAAGEGLEFSHWIPARVGGPNSIWNGNYVSITEHALSDPSRYRFMPKAWKAENPMPDLLEQQWNRIPEVYNGIGVGLGVSGAANAGQIGLWNNTSEIK